MEGDGGKPLSFGDVVKGQEKHDVARTFSALLQLVNLPLRSFDHSFHTQEISFETINNICCSAASLL